MKRKLILTIFAVFLVAIYWILFTQNIQKNKSITPPTNKSSFFTSPYALFNINYPSYFDIEYDETITILKDSSNKGEIIINRNGTNFTDINSYLSDFDLKRTVKTQPCPSIHTQYIFFCRLETFENLQITQKIYYLQISTWVYTISTTTPELYDELDQIVKSFRYTGE